MQDYKPLDMHALTVLKFLKPVTYTDPDGRKRVHLDPENLKEVLPEAVVIYQDETVIDWSAVDVVLIEALSELLDRINALEATVLAS